MIQPVKRRSVTDLRTWNDLVASLPGGHVLQSWQWGDFKERYGWRAERIAWMDENGDPQAAAQILSRCLTQNPIGRRLRVLYCPRGPVLDWTQENLRRQVLSDLSDLAAEHGAIFLKIDPDLPTGYGLPGEPDAEDDAVGLSVTEDLASHGWRESAEQIQFRNTLTLDLTLPEEALLAGMRQKTRYNVHLATRRGVSVRLGELGDLNLLYQMYAETSLRDGFVIRRPEYYQDAWGAFIQAGMAQPFIAEVKGEPIAAIVVFRFAGSALYMYGMSRREHREKMPNYLLQWEAIRWAAHVGCVTYDFWGAPNRFDPQEPMWGVYRFKQGFGARLLRTIGAWDIVNRPALYWFYSAAMPRILSLMRARGRAQTRQNLD